MTRTTVWTTLAFFMLAMFLPACSENMPTEQETTQQEDTTDDFTALEQEAELYQYWIDQMDSFVTQSEDGTYVFDQEAFLGSLSNDRSELVQQLALSDEDNPDSKVILELMESIDIGNEQILSEKAALWSGCWTRWWGRKCCYAGGDAEYTIHLMNISAWISSLNWISGAIMHAYAYWAGYLNSNCGGFCINATWVGGVWLTCP
ncbi:MAG: hypothetical protein V1853_00920 [bacterium]